MPASGDQQVVQLLVGPLVVEGHTGDPKVAPLFGEAVNRGVMLADVDLVQRRADVRGALHPPAFDPPQALFDRGVQRRPDDPEFAHPRQPRLLRKFRRSPVALPDQVSMLLAVVLDDLAPQRPFHEVGAGSA
jgi:hypothetical protein